MRSNLIGHTIFLTSEKYGMTNQKPDTIFFTSEKIRIGFSCLSRRSCEVIESECLQCFLLSQSLQTLIQWNNLLRPRKRKYKKENSTEFRRSNLSQVFDCYTTTVHSVIEVVASNVDLYRCCYSWWSIQYLYQQP